MSDAEPGRLHAYYEARGLSPTFGNLRSEEDLARHAAARARLFTDRLNLPPRSSREFALRSAPMPKASSSKES